MGEPGGTISLLREGREQGRKEGKVGTAGQEAKQNQVSLSIMAYHCTNCHSLSLIHFYSSPKRFTVLPPFSATLLTAAEEDRGHIRSRAANYSSYDANLPVIPQ